MNHVITVPTGELKAVGQCAAEALVVIVRRVRETLSAAMTWIERVKVDGCPMFIQSLFTFTGRYRKD